MKICVRESAAEYFLSSRGHESWSRIFQTFNPLVCWELVFDTELGATPHMGYLGCLASHWSVTVRNSTLCPRFWSLMKFGKDVA